MRDDSTPGATGDVIKAIKVKRMGRILVHTHRVKLPQLGMFCQIPFRILRQARLKDSIDYPSFHPIAGIVKIGYRGTGMNQGVEQGTVRIAEFLIHHGYERLEVL